MCSAAPRPRSLRWWSPARGTEAHMERDTGDHDPLAVDAETMRRLGYEVVDWLVERAGGLGDEPVIVRATPPEMAGGVPSAPPRGGVDAGTILEFPGRLRAFRRRVGKAPFPPVRA